MPGTARSRPAGDTVRTRLSRAGERGAGEEPHYLASSSVVLAHARESGDDGDVIGTLPVLIHRLAFLDKRRHPFVAILQRKGRMKQVAFGVESFGQRRFE